MERSKFYTFIFALIVCVIASTIISVTAVGLQSRKEINVEIDRKKKILNSVGLGDKVSSLKEAQAILDLYDQTIKSIVVDANGDIISGKNAEDITEDEAGSQFPIYISTENNSVEAIAIPVSGKGLWSTLYGYFALEKDLTTVKGITFYKHGETPGLGGEIEKPWFQDNFVGKKIFDSNGELTSITVIKGKVDALINDPEEKSHSVDGISGATITSNGVTNLLKRWLKVYEPFFKKVKRTGLSDLV